MISLTRQYYLVSTPYMQIYKYIIDYVFNISSVYYFWSVRYVLFCWLCCSSQPLGCRQPLPRPTPAPVRAQTLAPRAEPCQPAFQTTWAAREESNSSPRLIYTSTGLAQQRLIKSCSTCAHSELLYDLSS